MSEVIRKTVIQDGKIYNQTIQDPSAILDFNAAVRNSRPEFGKYKGNLTHVGKLSLEFIEKMANGQCCPDGKNYKLMSRDTEERRRALVHVQAEHKNWLTVSGKPFALKRPTWR